MFASKRTENVLCSGYKIHEEVEGICKQVSKTLFRRGKR